MSPPRRSVALLLLAALSLAGCRLQVEQIVRNRSHSMRAFDAIALARDGRREVLARLGPPDRIEYQIDTVVFDYESAEHRASRFEIYFPSDVIPGFNPLAFLSIAGFFFDPAEAPEVFDPSRIERISRGLLSLATRLVPFSSGEELLTMMGHQQRTDRLRVVLDRETRSVIAKSLRRATGEYREENMVEQIFLQTD